MKISKVQEILKSQAPVDYDTAGVVNPVVQNDWYTADSDLSDGKACEIHYIIVEQTCNGATQETLELEVTINGTARTWTLTNINSGTRYYCYINDSNVLVNHTSRTKMGGIVSGDSQTPNTFDRVGLIRVRQTSAVDPVSAILEINVVWKKLEVK